MFRARRSTPQSKPQRDQESAADGAAPEHEPAQRTRAGRRDATVGFAAICLAYFAIILDGSILNVAIPSIRNSLNGSMAEAQWVLNGYTLALAALLLTGGVMGDRIGLRRSLLWGTAVFTLASAACAVAPTVELLIVARVAQGIGAAALLPATLALVPHLFTQPTERGRATIIWVATGAIAVAVGPLVGGLLIDAVGWRSVFLINVPVGIVSMALVLWRVTAPPPHPSRIDHAGQLAASATLALLTAGLILGGSAGWSSPATIGLLVGGIAAGTGFWLVESHSTHPMLPPAFVKHRIRSTALASAALMGFLFYGTLFVMSLYFQDVRHWPAGQAGVGLIPLTVGTCIGPLILYRPLAARFGHRVMLLAGFCCCLLGVLALGQAQPSTSYATLAVGLFLVGIASTISFSALTTLLLSNTPDDQSGLASGAQNTTRQSGALIAVAILGSVLNTPDMAARVWPAFVVLAGANLVAILISAAALRARQPAR
jgi:MFS transporter, DHA2 family, methylenomycin A resistance protein